MTICKRSVRLHVESLEDRRVLEATTTPGASLALQRFDSYLIDNESVRVATVGDFDGDASSELILGGPGGVLVYAPADLTTEERTPLVSLDTGPVTRVAASDLNGDGRLDLLVVTDASVVWYQNLGPANGTWQGFAAGVVLSLGPATPQVADVTGDGITDLILDYVSRFDVLAGIGNGSFGPPISFAIGSDLTMQRGLAIGDTNGDGSLDIAVFQPDLGQLTVLLNDGEGIFETVSHTIDSLGINEIELEDINSDGVLDIIYAQGGSVRIFHGLGDGTFEALGRQLFTVGTVVEIRIDDVNRDTRLDILVRNSGTLHDPYLGNTSGSVSILLGQRNGIFSDSVEAAYGSWNALVIDDDTKAIAVFGATDNERFRVVAPSVFSPETTGHRVFPENSQTSLFVDVNQDGFSDVITANREFLREVSLSVVLADGAGGFVTAGSLAVEFSSLRLYSIGTGELVRIAIAGRTLDGSTLLATVRVDAAGEFQELVQVPVDLNVAKLNWGDLNGDGVLDFVGPTFGVNSDDGSTSNPLVHAWLGNTDGGFTFLRDLPVAGAYQRSELVDVNNDGVMDILVQTVSASSPAGDLGAISIYLGSGGGSFSLMTTLPTTGLGFAVSDLDGDGDVSLVFPARTVLGVLGIGNASLSIENIVPVPSQVASVHALDVDGDGSPDLVTTTAGGDVTVVWNDENQFTTEESFSVGRSVDKLLVRDIDANGVLDIMTVWYGPDPRVGGRFPAGSPTAHVALMLGRDTRAFIPPTHYNLNITNGDGVLLEDINADGNVDVLMAGMLGFLSWQHLEPIVGDVTGDAKVDELDIDLLCAAISDPPPDIARFDLDGDQQLGRGDMVYLVETVLATKEGDANLDGRVDFNDFLRFAASFGKDKMSWSEGDFNSDGVVDFADFVKLSASFGFGV